MEKFVQRYQPERYELWKQGLDIEPHPEDPPDIRDEVMERAKDPKEFARRIEEKNRNKLKKIKEKEKTENKEIIYEAQVYQLVVNRRIEIEIETEPFKVLSSLGLLQKYLQRQDLDVQQMIETGELVWAGTRPIQMPKKRKAEEEVVEKVEEEKFIVEQKTVALYKHAHTETRLHVSVDPITKELTSEPSTKLMTFLKDNDSATSVKELIDCGVFIKVCDCIMEVKKIKMKTSVQPPAPKKIKTEIGAEVPSTTSSNTTVKPETTPVAAASKPGPTPRLHLDIYRHKATGSHFTISKSYKIIGRLSDEKKAIFEGTTVQNLIDEGQLRRIGSRKVRDTAVEPCLPTTKSIIRRGIFTLPYDQEETRIELAASDHRYVYCLPSLNSEIANILSDTTDTQELSSTLTRIGTAQDCQIPIGIMEAMLNPSLQFCQSEGLLRGTENVTALLLKNSPQEDAKFSHHYDPERKLISWIDSCQDRQYLIRDGSLPPALFDVPKKEKVKSEVKKEPVKQPVEKEPSDFDENDDDSDDDDDDLM